MAQGLRYIPTQQVRVGTCGFAEAQARTFRDFDLIEVQRTFYQPPRAETAARWRDQAPQGFVFTLKAWQLPTHAPTSPTYRRLKKTFSDAKLARAGGLKWNDVTRMAWASTQEIADALAAQAIVFQMPRSFTPSQETLRNLYRLFEHIDRRGRRMCLEPRSETWNDAALRKLVADLDLTHVVDPFLRGPVGRGLRYFRLHGRPAYHYHHRYSDADLVELEGVLNHAWPNWVLFNNDAMSGDARRFIKRIRKIRTRGDDRDRVSLID